MAYPTTQPLKIKINGVDRTSSIPVGSIDIENVLTKQIDTSRFLVEDGGGFGISDLQTVIISNPAETVRYFAGLIESFDVLSRGPRLDYPLTMVDFTWLLDHPEALVNAEYTDQDDSAIIDAFMDAAAPDIEDTTYVKTVRSSLERQQYSRMTPRQALDALAEITGADWYVDEGPGPGAQLAYLHYFATEENTAPYSLSNAPDDVTSFGYTDLVDTHLAASANLIEVVGGEYLSTDQTIYLANDGTQTNVQLPFKCSAPDGQSAIQVWVNDGTDGTPVWTAKTVGTGYIHDISDYDCLNFFQEKYLEFATAPPELELAVKITCRYWIPLRQRVRDYVSYANYGRWMADKIVDANITDKDTAKKRAKIELARRAATQVSYTLNTLEPGLRSGQHVRLVNAARGVDDTFLIQRVVTRSLGGGYASFAVELGLYNPNLVDIIAALKRAESGATWGADDVLDELLENAEAVGVADTASETASSGPYLWDAFNWGFGVWG